MVKVFITWYGKSCDNDVGQCFLFGQLFPDAQWVNGMTSGDLMDEMKERLRKMFKNMYQKKRVC